MLCDMLIYTGDVIAKTVHSELPMYNICKYSTPLADNTMVTYILL